MHNLIIKSSLLLFISCSLTAFTNAPGGEGFEVYLDDKLIMQQYGSEMNSLKSVQLDQRSEKSILTVKYHHCGKVGKNRVISLLNADGKAIRQWRFSDKNEPLTPMNCAVRDILAASKGNAVFRLYYSSTELPKGRTIASVNIKQTSTTSVATN